MSSSVHIVIKQEPGFDDFGFEIEDTDTHLGPHLNSHGDPYNYGYSSAPSDHPSDPFAFIKDQSESKSNESSGIDVHVDSTSNFLPIPSNTIKTEPPDYLSFDINYVNNSSNDPPSKDFDPFANIKCELEEFAEDNSSSRSISSSSSSSSNHFEGEDHDQDPDFIFDLDQYQQEDQSEVKYHASHQFFTDANLGKDCLEIESQGQSQLGQDQGQRITRSKLNNNKLNSPSSTSSPQKQRRKQELKPKSDSKPKQSNYKPKSKCQCPLCPKLFPCNSALQSHIESHKSKEEQCRPFMCEICGLTFRIQYNWSNHLKTHSDERPFSCPRPNCSQAFKTKRVLRTHLLVTHSDSRPFPCPVPVCGKSFKDKKNLQLHMRVTHSEERPHQCKELNCGMSFATPGILNFHIKAKHSEILNGLPTFPCEVCGKVFNMKWQLKRHSLVHTDDRPFKCNYEGCSSTYKRKHKLVEHQKLHTAEQDLCSKVMQAKAIN